MNVDGLFFPIGVLVVFCRNSSNMSSTYLDLQFNIHTYLYYYRPCSSRKGVKDTTIAAIKAHGFLRLRLLDIPPLLNGAPSICDRD